MALYTGERDISLFRHLNKELIERIISTEVDYYKIILAENETNIYGERPVNKSFYVPVRVACLISREDIDNSPAEGLGEDVNQIVTFAFLRDGILDEMNLVPEIGDIIDWDAKYFEVNGLNINQYVSGKNDFPNLAPLRLGERKI